MKAFKKMKDKAGQHAGPKEATKADKAVTMLKGVQKTPLLSVKGGQNRRERLNRRRVRIQSQKESERLEKKFVELHGPLELEYPNDGKRAELEDSLKAAVAGIVEECKSNGTKYTDTAFARDVMMWVDPSAGKGTMNDDIDVPSDFQRLSDLYEDVTLFKGPPRPDDMDQGAIGTCYLLASICVLASLPAPEGEDESARPLLTDLFVACDPAVGVYALRLYLNGAWRGVIVDDIMPVNVNGKLMFACTKPGEAYACILEKAYAKAHGCYECIDGGIDRLAMSDLTGGAFETLDLYDVEDPNTLASTPVLGLWMGYWYPGKKSLLGMTKMQMLSYISFRGGIITGGGDDEGSPYLISGRLFDVKDGVGKVQFSKHYILRHTVEYEGEYSRATKTMKGTYYVYGHSHKGEWKLTQASHFQEEEDEESTSLFNKLGDAKDKLQRRKVEGPARLCTLFAEDEEEDEEEFDENKALDAFSTVWNFLVVRLTEGTALISCSMEGEEDAEEDKWRTEFGLHLNHCYGIVGAVELSNGVRLVKLRNPLKGFDGTGEEWTGAWGDDSPEWTPELLKESGHVSSGKDSVFMMPYEEWLRYFTALEICRIFDDSYHSRRLVGSFDQERSGGPSQWTRNPQYRLFPQKKGRFTITIMQPDTKLFLADDYFCEIGFRVAVASEPTQSLYSNDTLTIAEVEPSAERAVSLEITLQKLGQPLFIVPFTSKPSQQLPFVLTVHASCDFLLTDAFAPKPENYPLSGYYEGIGHLNFREDGVVESTTGAKHIAGVWKGNQATFVTIKRGSGENQIAKRHRGEIDNVAREFRGQRQTIKWCNFTAKFRDKEPVSMPSGLWVGSFQSIKMRPSSFYTASRRNNVSLTLQIDNGWIHGFGARLGKFYNTISGFVDHDNKVAFTSCVVGDTELTTDSASRNEIYFDTNYVGEYDPVAQEMGLYKLEGTSTVSRISFKPTKSDGVFCETVDRQADPQWFVCQTCPSFVTCCIPCAKKCHLGHKLSYVEQSLFTCDCTETCSFVATNDNDPLPSLDDVTVLDETAASGDDANRPRDDGEDPAPPPADNAVDDGPKEEVVQGEGDEACTFATGDSDVPTFQKWVVCHSCTKNASFKSIVCGSCAGMCHEGHQLLPFNSKAVKKHLPPGVELKCTCESCRALGDPPGPLFIVQTVTYPEDIMLADGNTVSALQQYVAEATATVEGSESVLAMQSGDALRVYDRDIGEAIMWGIAADGSEGQVDMSNIELKEDPSARVVVGMDVAITKAGGRRHVGMNMTVFHPNLNQSAQIGFYVGDEENSDDLLSKGTFYGIDVETLAGVGPNGKAFSGAPPSTSAGQWWLVVDLQQGELVFNSPSGQVITRHMDGPTDHLRVCPAVVLSAGVSVHFDPYSPREASTPLLLPLFDHAENADWENFSSWYYGGTRDRMRAQLGDSSCSDSESEEEEEEEEGTAAEDMGAGAVIDKLSLPWAKTSMVFGTPAGMKDDILRLPRLRSLVAHARSSTVRRARSQNVRRARAQNVRRARAQNVRRARSQNVRRARAQNVRRARSQNARRARGENVRRARSKSVRRARGMAVRRARGKQVRRTRNKKVRRNRSHAVRGASTDAN